MSRRFGRNRRRRLRQALRAARIEIAYWRWRYSFEASDEAGAQIDDVPGDK